MRASLHEAGPVDASEPVSSLSPSPLPDDTTELLPVDSASNSTGETGVQIEIDKFSEQADWPSPSSISPISVVHRDFYDRVSTPYHDDLQSRRTHLPAVGHYPFFDQDEPDQRNEEEPTGSLARLLIQRRARTMARSTHPNVVILSSMQELRSNESHDDETEEPSDSLTRVRLQRRGRSSHPESPPIRFPLAMTAEPSDSLTRLRIARRGLAHR